MVLSPAGAVSEGAQWEVDSGAWQNSGATVSGLAVGSHTVSFLMLPGWGLPASQIVTVNFNQTTTTTAAYLAPHPATATAIMTNGFVVAATITDAGIGYTNTPLVYLVGGGESSSSRFGHFTPKVGRQVTGDGWPGDAGGRASERLVTGRRFLEPAASGVWEG